MNEEFEPYWCPVQTLVVQDNTLSDAAFRLYALYQIKILKEDGNIGIDDKRAANWFGWSLQKLRKAKKELVDKRWLVEAVKYPTAETLLFTQPKAAAYMNKVYKLLEAEYGEKVAEKELSYWWEDFESFAKLTM